MENGLTDEKMEKPMTKNEIRKPILLIFLVTVVIGIVLLILTLGNQDTLRIGIFYGSNWEVPGTVHYDIFDQAIEKYQKNYKNIEVEYVEGIPSEEYSEWLSGQILQGTEPDVFIILDEDFQTLASAGILKSLDALLAKDDEADTSIFYTSAVKSGIYQGEQYALPFECNPTLMFVNKTLLKQEGIEMPDDDWTWDDFIDICQQVVKDTDGDGQIDQFGYYDYTWEQAVYSNGLTLFDEEGTESYLTEDSFQEAINFARELNDTNQGYQVTSNDFDLGNVVFRPLTFSEYRTYMPYPWRIKKYSDFEWNCISMPSGPSGNNTSSMETLMVGISSQTTKEEEAWEFLKMLTMDEEIQSLIYQDTSGASALKSVTTSEEIMVWLNEDTPGGSDIDLFLLDQAIENAVVPENFS
ncbi:MAG: extracellular solute-binding protein [Clostridiales bacterium]|nr:extracellular solute-binding protein [Clostridiales bacterium]